MAPLHPDIAGALSANPFYRALPPELRAALLEEAEVRSFGRGEWVYGTGDAPRGIFAVLSGSALVYMALARGDDVLVHVARPGEVFGHAARLGHGPRLATILTARASRFLVLSEPALERLGRVSPEFWAALTGLLYQQYGDLLTQFARHLALPARARLAGRLLQFSQGDAGGAARLPQTQLAELTGVTRKTVNVLLAELSGKGLVSVGHGRVTVTDRQALQRVAEG